MRARPDQSLARAALGRCMRSQSAVEVKQQDWTLVSTACTSMNNMIHVQSDCLYNWYKLDDKDWIAVGMHHAALQHYTTSCLTIASFGQSGDCEESHDDVALH